MLVRPTLAKREGTTNSSRFSRFFQPLPARSISRFLHRCQFIFRLESTCVCCFLLFVMFSPPLSLSPPFVSSFVFVSPFLFLPFRLLPLLLLLFSLFPPRFLPNGEPFRLTIDGGALYAAARTLTEGQKSLSPPRVFPLASHIALGPAPALLHRLLNHHHHHHLEQRENGAVLGISYRSGIIVGVDIASRILSSIFYCPRFYCEENACEEESGKRFRVIQSFDTICKRNFAAISCTRFTF